MQPRRIRVAHVVRQLDTGGMERLLVELARHADRARFDLRFVALATRGAPAEDIEAAGWPVETLGVGPGLRLGLPFRLAGLFRRWGVDVVHTHNNAPLLYAAPAARLAGARVVHTRHGQSYRAGRRERLGFRFACLLAGRVVCVSDDSARLSAADGVAPSRLRRIWNGIDLARFGYRGPQPGGPAVMVARLSPEKGGEHLIRAAALVARRAPDFRLEVAGDGPCAPALKRLAAEEGVADRVRFLGEVRDVPAVLARAGLFVLPSLSEGVSLTLLEAMARGLPVVTTRVGGSPEVVADGVTGHLVPAGDAAALADKLLAVLAAPERARAMGLAGRRRVEEHFNAGGMTRQYEALYEQMTRRACA